MINDVQVVKLSPPASLLTITDIPVIHGDTNDDLINWALDLEFAAKQGNRKIEAIKRWINLQN